MHILKKVNLKHRATLGNHISRSSTFHLALSMSLIEILFHVRGQVNLSVKCQLKSLFQEVWTNGPSDIVPLGITH